MAILKSVSGTGNSYIDSSHDLLILGLFEGNSIGPLQKSLDGKINNKLSKAIELDQFSGKKEKTLPVPISITEPILGGLSDSSMVKKKDTLSLVEKTWRFDNKVALKFDTHVNQSIPHYLDLQSYTVKLSEWFLKDNTLVYDLGCSTGETIKEILNLNKSCIIPRLNQLLTTIKTIKLIKQGKKKFLWGSIPRSGKTYMAGYLIDRLFRIEPMYNNQLPNILFTSLTEVK